MKTKKPFDNLHTAWAIASKDIVDALKNKSTRINIIILMLMMVFFYWASTPRPFDKKLDVVYYDEGQSSLTALPAELADGYSFRFFEADSLREMQRSMGYKQLGLVIPVDFDQRLEAGDEAVLDGYLMWVYRGRAAELESLYSEKFSELLGRPVSVEIGENIVIPEPDVHFNDVNVHILFGVFFMALTLVPNLMLEEKQSKTIDALMVSPASPAQVVLGKALAGLFYVLLSGGLFFSLNWAYVSQWWLALLAFLCITMFSIGLALVLGSAAKSQQQMNIIAYPVFAVFMLSAFFAQEPLLAQGLKNVLSWVPTTALVDILRLSFSTHAPAGMLLKDLAISLASIAIVFGIVIWQVRRADR